jgi:hypothetical protein
VLRRVVRDIANRCAKFRLEFFQRVVEHPRVSRSP